MTTERICHTFICDDTADFQARKTVIQANIAAMENSEDFTEEYDEPNLEIRITQPDRTIPA